MRKRIFTNVEIDADAKTRLLELGKQTGMKQVEIATRLTRWFSIQPATVQSAILQHNVAPLGDPAVQSILAEAIRATSRFIPTTKTERDQNDKEGIIKASSL